MKPTLVGQRALVVGLGRSGVAAAKLLAREGAQVTATDGRQARALEGAVRELRPLGVRFELGGHDPASFADAAWVVVSPGVPLASPVFAKAGRVVGEVELASRFVDEPVVGVTGTNGKSTTTALIAHLLATAGKDVFAGGNLGVPLAERVLAGGARDASVVELSSYQLEAVDTFHPHVAVVTNLAPDHLDRYPSVQAYWGAKGAIFRRQTEADFAVLNLDDAQVLHLHRHGRAQVVGFSSRGPVERGAWDDGEALQVRGLPGVVRGESYQELAPALRGAHGRQNAMAALLAARLLGAAPDAVAEGLRTFPGLPHRLQSVRVLQGVEWINDSKATNVDAAQVALAAFPGRVLWIAGGKGKGAPYTPLRPWVEGRVQRLLTIGADGDRIAAELGDLTVHERCETLDVAVARAAAHAAAGDTVLFSPGCASFDQFRDFEARGEAFVAAVEGLG
jgi:UDP-N-acetylmuramoylalanine--D-glutamate ligase